MNALKDLFTASFVEAVSLRIVRFNLFDLRTKVDFTFFSPVGIVVLLLLTWAMAKANDVGAISECDIATAVSSCGGVWPVLIALVSVSTLSGVVIRWVSSELSVATFADNTVVVFLTGAFFLYVLRMSAEGRSSAYDILGDRLADMGLVGDSPTTAVAAGLVTILSIIVLGAYSLRRRLLQLPKILAVTGTRGRLVILVYALSSVAMIFFVFGYEG